MLVVTQIGVCVVYVLLAAENIQSLLHSVGVEVSLCYWLLILCFLLTSLSWLDTPKDFWSVTIDE